nr:uncharacterized protein LOC129011726 isoform X3 [Pongo pygmaeus]
MQTEKSKPWWSKQLRFDKNNKSGSFSSFSKPFCQNKLVLLGRRNCLRPYAPICSLQKCLGLFHTEPVGGGGDHCRWTGQKSGGSKSKKEDVMTKPEVGGMSFEDGKGARSYGM